MATNPSYDGVVIGSGPNGLSAAITLARAGWSVLVREGAPTAGGSARSAELTLPGFVHDVCSTVLALGRLSPFLRTLPLESHGVGWAFPQTEFAQPFDDGSAAVVERSVDATAERLGEDREAYRRLFGPLVQGWERLIPDVLGPLRVPRHPLLAMRFGLDAIRSARSLAASRFKGEASRALFAGAAAHSMLPLEWRATAAFGMVLTLSAHATGWPVARGGTQNFSNALVSYLKSLGGEIETASPVQTLGELPRCRAVLCDVTPRQFLQLAGDQLPSGYRAALERYRYGPGVFKVDWALSAAIPWKSAACARAGTIHLGGTLQELCDAERAPWEGRLAERPYVLLVQPTVFDPSRAPTGRHTAWAYCHVPHGSSADSTEAIERQVERFAPGFKDVILARHVMAPADLQRHNPNLIGGDINGGAQNLAQLFSRPVRRANPYATPLKGVYLCSSSTPPGGGVHGMCGHFAAQAALKDSGERSPGDRP